MQTHDPLQTPVRVRRCVVRGLRKTHEGVVRQELDVVERAATVGELRDACLKAAGALQSLGIFDAADLLMDTARAPRQGGDTVQAEVVCTVVEKKRLVSATTTVATESGEGTLEGKVSVRNSLGRAENFEMQLEAGQQKSSVFRLSATKPRWLGRDAQLTADVSKQAVSHLKHSSFVQKLLGASVSAKAGSPDIAGGCHELGYSVELREVCRLPPHTASWSVLQQRGSSLKGSLTHSYSRNTLDNPLVPTCGGMLRSVTELAGVAPLPIGDSCFCKHSLTAAAFCPLLPSRRVAIGVQLQAGLLLPLKLPSSTPPAEVPTAGSLTESNICDRFHLGGPGSLWGFRTRGVGPRDVRHSLQAHANSEAARMKSKVSERPTRCMQASRHARCARSASLACEASTRLYALPA